MAMSASGRACLSNEATYFDDPLAVPAADVMVFGAVMNQPSNLKRNGVYNFLGSTLPIFVSLVTIPLYLSHVGAAGYGILTIVWMLQGYFGFFDMGLARATSNQIAKLQDATNAERESVLWTALLLNAGLGLVGGVVLYFFGSLVIDHFVQTTDVMRQQVASVMPWVGASVPITTVSGALVGSLEGREKFGVLNAVQLGNMFLFQTIPLIASYVIGPDVRILIPAAIMGGIASVVFLAIAVVTSFPIRFSSGPRREHIRPLFGYGAWVSVSNFIVPIMEAADRFIISSALGPAAVAQYNVPYNLSIRVRILPSVLARTIFPRMSAQDSSTSLLFFVQAATLLAATLTPVIVLGIFAMGPFITLWIGPGFAATAAPIGCVLLIGIWFNSLATVPGTYLQAQSRPGVVARLQLWQIAPFLLVLWWSIHHFGLLGAAWVWTARVIIDAVLLFKATSRSRELMRLAYPAIILLGASYLVNLLFVSSIWQAVLCGLPMVLCACAWSLRTEPYFGEAFRTMMHRLTKTRNAT